jgi:hypothetical protein
VEEQARLALQRHESDSRSWSSERSSLQSQLALHQQESSVASASLMSTIDKLETEVIHLQALHCSCLLLFSFVLILPGEQITQLSRQVVLLQRPTSCDAAEQTDPFEGTLFLGSIVASVLFY